MSQGMNFANMMYQVAIEMGERDGRAHDREEVNREISRREAEERAAYHANRERARRNERRG